MNQMPIIIRKTNKIAIGINIFIQKDNYSGGLLLSNTFSLVCSANYFMLTSSQIQQGRLG